MSEKELNIYRFNPDQEPTEEMLKQIMKEFVSPIGKIYSILLGTFFRLLIVYTI